MQNYLDQLAKLNELLAPHPFNLWAFLGATLLFLVSFAILMVGLVLIWTASPLDTLVKAAIGGATTHSLKVSQRLTCLGVGIALFFVSTYISPVSYMSFNNDEAERVVHNTLMDMNEIDYKTLVEGANRYELDKNDTKKYKELIKIIKKAANRRPVQ